MLIRSTTKACLNKSGIPDFLRHRFAKNFIERNSDIALLADLMEHESLETTRVYLRRTASEQRAAVDEAVIW